MTPTDENLRRARALLPGTYGDDPEFVASIALALDEAERRGAQRMPDNYRPGGAWSNVSTPERK